MGFPRRRSSFSGVPFPPRKSASIPPDGVSGNAGGSLLGLELLGSPIMLPIFFPNAGFGTVKLGGPLPPPFGEYSALRRSQENGRCAPLGLNLQFSACSPAAARCPRFSVLSWEKP